MQSQSEAQTWPETAGARRSSFRERDINRYREKIARLNAAISEIEPQLQMLEQDVQLELSRSPVQDPGHVAFSFAARQALVRRDNLLGTLDFLNRNLRQARQVLSLLREELV
jgi:hypothetical protein